MLFQGFFDGLEYLGNTVKVIASSADLAIESYRTDRLIKSAEKHDKKVQDKIADIEVELRDNVEDAFDMKVSFNDIKDEDQIDYSSGWTEQFDWLSRFMNKIMKSKTSEKEFNPDDFKREDIIKWINFLADPEVQENAHAFEVNHQTNLLHWIMQQCSNILYEKYPGYEDLFLDKEEALRKFNINLLSKQVESGKEQGKQVHLMVKLPDADEKVQINMPSPFDEEQIDPNGSATPTSVG